jgi:hypothetical protein
MRAEIHKDAKVTVFMDFNNDLRYDRFPNNGWPSELVFSKITAVNDWYLTDTFRLPKDLIIPNTPTGMRVIINENTGPNTPSDDACGTYTSGETEDFVVVFRKAGTTGVGGNIGSIRNLGLFPNPTSGKFKLTYEADKAIKDLKVTVTNVTGQVLLQQGFQNPGKSFSNEFDLSDQARGIYFIELRADGDKAVRKLVVR